jgi:hypothetical protein
MEAKDTIVPLEDNVVAPLHTIPQIDQDKRRARGEVGALEIATLNTRRHEIATRSTTTGVISCDYPVFPPSHLIFRGLAIIPVFSNERFPVGR